MFTVTKETEIEMSHRLMGHDGKCSKLHGHTWKIVVGFEKEKLKTKGSDRGMVFDFSFIKKSVLNSIKGIYDHSVVLEKGDVLIGLLNSQDQKVVEVPFRPTSENLAKHFCEMIEYASFVRIWETPTSMAEYHV